MLASSSNSGPPPGFSDFIAGTDGSQVTTTASREVGADSPDPLTERNEADSPDAPEHPRHEFDLASCLDDWTDARGCFRSTGEEEPAPPKADAPTMPAITITDLARFAPEAVTVAAEPDGLGVAGLPANFVAKASPHTSTGSLFGTAVDVQFTPVGYDFTFGDGTTATTATGGQTWAALGQTPFTPTATSHAYRERGTYRAHVTIRYTARVDLGGGWFPVAGELAIAGPASEIRIFEARTALVAFTCEQRPSDPGC